MMGIMVPETCWASNKICNKNLSVASSWHFISKHYTDLSFFDVLHFVDNEILNCRNVNKLTWILRFLDYDNMLFGHLTNNTVSLVPVYRTGRRRTDPSTISQDVCFVEADVYCRHCKNSKSHFWSVIRLTSSKFIHLWMYRSIRSGRRQTGSFGLEPWLSRATDSRCVGFNLVMRHALCNDAFVILPLTVNIEIVF